MSEQLDAQLDIQLRCWHCNSNVYTGESGWTCPKCGQHGSPLGDDYPAGTAEEGHERNCPYLLTILETPELLDQLRSLHQKYWDLVWYARSDPDCYPDADDALRAAVFIKQTHIEGVYPKETEGLASENGAWVHGFNSGMLAALNLVMGTVELGLDAALEEFPMLDT